MRWSKAGEVVSKSFPLTVGSARGLLDGNENENIPRISKKSPTKQTNCLSQLPQIIPTKLGFVFQFLHALNNQNTADPSGHSVDTFGSHWPNAPPHAWRWDVASSQTANRIDLFVSIRGDVNQGLPGYPPRIPETTSNILLMGSEDSSKPRPVEVTVGSLLHMIYKVIKYRFQVVQEFWKSTVAPETWDGWNTIVSFWGKWPIFQCKSWKICLELPSSG